jgi:hypothetical protein
MIRPLAVVALLLAVALLGLAGVIAGVVFSRKADEKKPREECIPMHMGSDVVARELKRANPERTFCGRG